MNSSQSVGTTETEQDPPGPMGPRSKQAPEPEMQRELPDSSCDRHEGTRPGPSNLAHTFLLPCCPPHSPAGSQREL